jgi:transposase
VDAQSVKNADTAEEKGYDGGKPSRYILPKLCQTSVRQSLRQFAKVSGIKRHIAVDTNGFPHAIHVTTANISDKAGAIEMFEESRDRASLPRVENILLDGGYTGQPFADKIREILNCSVEVVKRSDVGMFKVIPKRWVVERCFAWLEKSRRLFKNVERKIPTSKQMVVLAFLAIFIKR